MKETDSCYNCGYELSPKTIEERLICPRCLKNIHRNRKFLFEVRATRYRFDVYCCNNPMYSFEKKEKKRKNKDIKYGIMLCNHCGKKIKYILSKTNSRPISDRMLFYEDAEEKRII